MQGAVEDRDGFGGEGLGCVLGLAGFVEPAGGLNLVLKGGSGADRGGAGEVQRRRLGVGWSAAPAAPTALGMKRDAQSLQDEDGLVAALG